MEYIPKRLEDVFDIPLIEWFTSPFAVAVGIAILYYLGWIFGYW